MVLSDSVNKIKKVTTRICSNDISPTMYYIVLTVVIVGRLLFASLQNIFLALPAPIDDGLMYEAALSLVNGQWLGDYDYLTLSKHMGFAFWEAALHLLTVPILVGNQIFIAVACLVTIAALSPVITTRLTRLLLFLILFLSPVNIAQFMLRPYRDSIFPAICLMVFACFIATALRVKMPIKNSIPYLVLGGFMLGFAYLSREDGYWLLPFTVVAGTITVIYLVAAHSATLIRLLSLLLPYVIVAVMIIGYSYMNLIHYGRFVVSDFSSGEFSAVIGAMSRVAPTEDDSWWSDEKISVPYSARSQIYTNVPEFALLEQHLEGEDFFNRYGYVQTNPTTGEKYIDYSSGGFYWALRHAAQLEGIYDDAQTAMIYWQSMADSINKLCDDGILSARFGERNSTMPPIRASYVLPVVGEALYSFWYTLTFQETSCYMESIRSYGEPADIVAMEDFLHQGANVAAVAGGTDPYYHPLYLLAYKIMDIFRLFYMVLVPIAFVAAVVVECRRIIGMIRQKITLDQNFMLRLICLGIMLMVIFRCFIIAFVQVASFTIGTYVMYLGSIHPLILLYIGVVLLSKIKVKEPNDL